MKLNWEIDKDRALTGAAKQNDREHSIHHSTVVGASEQDIQLAIDASVEKACELLENNIQDDSRYLLFGWDSEVSTLTIVVTDDDKRHDSRDVVQCHLVTGGQQPDPEDIQFWIKDYLTTCAPFLRYSLIAAFHRGSRATCTLL
ncbi:hypothetical protein JF535_13550 [Microbulbifer salipaludis]|uniref:Uncharacterized protein n=1 Tax=Microbulbifer salipaludis TaxID=187980 RepID=A0ABS3E988_9GAMM|nr:hypothetical protein [Microbulbifer salipaludis]MBN8431875.1 hypothetical protein [Microbulbifer salipaludis]